MSIDRKEVEALIRIFERSDWHELRLETDGLKLVLSKDADAAALGRQRRRPTLPRRRKPIRTRR